MHMQAELAEKRYSRFLLVLIQECRSQISRRIATVVFGFTYCFSSIGFGIAGLVIAGYYTGGCARPNLASDVLGFGVCSIILGATAFFGHFLQIRVNCNKHDHSRCGKVMARLVVPMTTAVSWLATVVLAGMASAEVWAYAEPACRVTALWQLAGPMFIAFWVVWGLLLGVLYPLWRFLLRCINGHPHGPGCYMTDECL